MKINLNVVDVNTLVHVIKMNKPLRPHAAVKTNKFNTLSAKRAHWNKLQKDLENFTGSNNDE